MNKNKKYKIIAVAVVALVVGVLFTGSAYANGDCEPTYGGGERCVFNKSFDIEKEVRKDEDDDFEDKVTDVDKNDTVEFQIKVKNVGDIEVDNMKYEDFLPDEMERVGGSGLTEEWNDFEPDEEVKFVIKAKIKESEFDRENFDKCIVNKVKVTFDGDFEGSDTATVCYGQGEVTELPKTGGESTIALTLLGLGLAIAGTLSKRKLI
ncbi:MAG TPA: LPXTG cell wall anchor domain-containing protein [Patescibacteria group bacterium]|nr:LPXTG cell wall anchor domain-containing protein [Patescibacteria group bacterium]